MTLFDLYEMSIPEYSKMMYLDGYAPYQILHAAHRSILDNAEDDDGYQITVTSEVPDK